MSHWNSSPVGVRPARPTEALKRKIRSLGRRLRRFRDTSWTICLKDKVRISGGLRKEAPCRPIGPVAFGVDRLHRAGTVARSPSRFHFVFGTALLLDGTELDWIFGDMPPPVGNDFTEGELIDFTRRGLRQLLAARSGRPAPVRKRPHGRGRA
jgi:hypothetical protein